jgi:uncharacterized glyoxalase superfamily protein PhnB
MTANTGPRFDQVNLISSDVGRSLDFYRLLGLEIPKPWSSGDAIHHARAETSEGLDLAFDSAAFAQVWNKGWEGRSDLAGRVVIGFRVATRDDVDTRYATLVEAGHQGLQAPFDAFWGARYAIVEDPDGLAVGLMSPVDPARRSPPPQV